MKKLLLLFTIINCQLFPPFGGINSFSQSLGGYLVSDYLVNTVPPHPCNDSYMTGAPNDSAWINFYPGGVITGNFGFPQTDTTGDELLLETAFHPSNYRVSLLLSTGLYSSFRVVHDTDWIQLADITWRYIYWSGSCVQGTQQDQRYIIPLDFSQHFGLTQSDTVTGIKINLLTTNLYPGLAGVYIVSSCSTVGFPASITQDADTLSATAAPNYQWYFNDALIPGANSQEYVITEEGFYYVVTTSEGCTFTSDIVETGCICVGMDENDFSKKISLYPNPGSSSITVETELTINNGKLKIMNAQGQLVQQLSIINYPLSIDVSQLTPGLYYLHLQSAEGVAVRRFEVMR